MIKEMEKVVRTVMIVLDAVIVSFMFSLAFASRPFFHAVPDLIPVSISDYIMVLVLVVLLWYVMLSLSGMYRSLRTRTFLEIGLIIIRAAFFTTLIFGAFVFLFKLRFISRSFFVILMAASSTSIALEKTIIYSVMHYMRRLGYNTRRLLIVGTGSRAANFIDKIKIHPAWGFRILGVIDDEKGHKGKKVEDVEIIGMLEDIPRILHNEPVDEVIFVVPRARLAYIENSLYICETAGVKATIAVDLFDLRIAKSRQTELEEIPLITFETTPAKEWELFLKMAADIAVAAPGLIILIPLFLLISILIKATSKGPAMFLQKRVGLNGRKFILYKFRTMYEGAHEKLSELTSLNIMKGPVFKMKDDPRVTPVGRFLRKFSLDELPQLFNVLLGHMSLVGPRPPLPKEVGRYEPWQRRRLSMRPGITCLWQISGRSKIDFDEWMKLDLEYIDNWSLWLDFKILVKTIPVVLFGVGAY